MDALEALAFGAAIGLLCSYVPGAVPVLMGILGFILYTGARASDHRRVDVGAVLRCLRDNHEKGGSPKC